MEVLAQLAAGFEVALTPTYLLLCLVGVAVGTAVGVLPGLGPTATISLLLPVTLAIDRTGAIIMLAGIYYGAMYGGSITSILVRIPGEAASIVTCLDGYEMARRGRASVALGMSAFGSFIAGIVATLGIAAVGPALATHALAFGPVERASLILLGLVLVVSVAQGSRLKAYMMVFAGLLLSSVGIDLVSGTERFTYGSPYLQDGFNIAVLAMGLFGISELLLLAERRQAQAEPLAYSSRLRDLLPTRQDWRASAGPIGRGSVLGFLLGLLPGGGAVIASFASYVVERRLAREPERFGKGAIEGLAGPESANNAAAQSAFVPLLCLGLPSNAVMGVVLGALMLHGVTPGPRLMETHPELFWGVIASMLVGNLMLVVLNVPLVGVFVAMLRVPAGILAPLVVLFCGIGAYSLNNNATDVLAMMGFGLLGYALRKGGFDPAPLLLAFVLGRMFEPLLRQGLILGYGDPMVFLESPLSASFLAGTALLVLWPLAAWLVRLARRRTPVR